MSIRYQKARQQIDVKHLKNIDFPDHIHDEVELIFVQSGEAIITINHQEHLMQQGDFAIAFPNMIHSYHKLESSVDCYAIVAIIPLKFCGVFLNTLMNEAPITPFISRHNVHPNVKFAMEALLLEHFGENSPNVCLALVQLVLSRIFPQLELTLVEKHESSDLIEHIIRYINQHFKEDITLCSLSSTLGVSKYHLSHIFSEKMHTHFRRYLNSIRANYTSVQIRTTDMPLTQIWTDAGFESQRTFNRAFKDLYGITPSEYRKNHINKRILDAGMPPSTE